MEGVRGHGDHCEGLGPGSEWAPWCMGLQLLGSGSLALVVLHLPYSPSGVPVAVVAQASPIGTVFGRAQQLQQELACKQGEGSAVQTAHRKASLPLSGLLYPTAVTCQLTAAKCQLTTAEALIPDDIHAHPLVFLSASAAPAGEHGPLSPEEFLQQWMASPGCRVCGRWQRRYAALHAAIRNGSAPGASSPSTTPSTCRGTSRARGWGTTSLGWSPPLSEVYPGGAPLRLFPKVLGKRQMCRGGRSVGKYSQRGMDSSTLLTFGSCACAVAGLLTDRAFVMPESRLTEIVDVSKIDWRVRDDVPMAIARVHRRYTTGRDTVTGGPLGVHSGSGTVTGGPNGDEYWKGHSDNGPLT